MYNFTRNHFNGCNQSICFLPCANTYYFLFISIGTVRVFCRPVCLSVILPLDCICSFVLPSLLDRLPPKCSFFISPLFSFISAVSFTIHIHNLHAVRTFQVLLHFNSQHFKWYLPLPLLLELREFSQTVSELSRQLMAPFVLPFRLRFYAAACFVLVCLLIASSIFIFPFSEFPPFPFSSTSPPSFYCSFF